MLGKAGSWSANVKSGRSAERQSKNGPERGALEIPRQAPFIGFAILIHFYGRFSFFRSILLRYIGFESNLCVHPQF